MRQRQPDGQGPWFDLIGCAADRLREAAGEHLDADVRVGPARSGEALLVAYLGGREVDLARLAHDLRPPVLGLAATAPSHPLILRLDPASVARAIGDLPRELPRLAFPAAMVVEGGAGPALAAIRVQAAVAAFGLDAAPDWDGRIDEPSRPLLRVLLGAARVRAGQQDARGWRQRLAAALDHQWRSARGTVMRLIDPASPDASRARLALAGRGAALLAAPPGLI